MNNYFEEFTFLLIFFFSSFFFSIILLIISLILVYQKPDKEKLSSYECGFFPFDDARMKYEARFYIIGILYIIFDVELMFLIPWVVAYSSLNFFSIFIGLFFILILLFGFFFELFLKVFDWRKWAN